MEGTLAFVTLFAGNFAPKNWAYCAGQLLPISQNTALFSLIGTYYGGNGTTTFALPDLRGRAVVGVGQAPGTSQYDIGQVGGTENTTITTSEMPAHAHPLQINIAPPSSSSTGTTNSPAGAVYALDAGSASAYGSVHNAVMKPYPVTLVTGNAGGGQVFNNRSPYLTLNYIICMMGIYPARN